MEIEPTFERGNRDTFNDISRRAIPNKDDPVEKGISEQRGSTAIRDERPLMSSATARV